jgi:glycerate 2-kinase
MTDTAFFGALRDAVITGPTLTNVNDFRAIYIGAPTASETSATSA